MSCKECGDEHLADGDDCLLAEVEECVDEGVPDEAPNDDDWEAAGVPIPEESDDLDPPAPAEPAPIQSLFSSAPVQDAPDASQDAKGPNDEEPEPGACEQVETT